LEGRHAPHPGRLAGAGHDAHGVVPGQRFAQPPQPVQALARVGQRAGAGGGLAFGHEAIGLRQDFGGGAGGGGALAFGAQGGRDAGGELFRLRHPLALGRQVHAGIPAAAEPAARAPSANRTPVPQRARVTQRVARLRRKEGGRRA
jgi:hypothetical protein